MSDGQPGPTHSMARSATEAAPTADLTGTGAEEQGVRTSIRIRQMDCPTEEAMIRKRLGSLSGVISLEFNLVQRLLTVEHTVGALAQITAAIRGLGFEPELNQEGSPFADLPQQAAPWWPLALAGALALLSEVAGWVGWSAWLAALLALAAVAGSGVSTYRKGWVAVRQGNLNINALMSVAVTGAFIIGQWPEAAMVMVLFNVAETIEARSLDRARNAISGLMSLAPAQVTVRQPDGSWQVRDPQTVEPGSVARVRPGERIALDGELVRGQSTINQAPITGESLPVEKSAGDAVFAGTINGAGSFEYRVTRVAADTTLARIIHAVEQAQGSKARTQRFVDRFAAVYTPLVFALALVVAVVPPLVSGGLWLDWVYRALVLLVIACPCALVLSTPVTIVSGLAAAARHGVLVKGGVFLEEGYKLAWLALDKTGTLTRGEPVQTGFELCGDGADADTCRRLAYSLAVRSDHPVSGAIAREAEPHARGGMPVENFTALAGMGVGGEIDGIYYVLGNCRLMETMGVCSPSLAQRLETLEERGFTAVMLARAEQVLALFSVADTVKASSAEAIAALHELGVKTIMLTGDNQRTANAIAAQVGIDKALGNQLPDDKLAAIQTLEQQGLVGMVGDGINDAPALAQAHIGIAMGALGSDTAIDTADVALMDDDLRKVAWFVRLSRRTRTLLVQNIALALGIKGVFLVLTVFGLATMWMAVFADVGASLLVVANGLRLLRSRLSRRA
ncbi:heavy metal translocating P-type ATPase [Marinobacter sp. X15-166B]|uniref:heavy metal translocating P-type ATPase n=1 Tax=Marinobacter sp. X15-166B TaxID=1897620 RepID=UPI00085C7C13|nr:heavy metal translocating P-type ATPase [Marinobacter sp. X15-166B]OEY65495.1 copper-translocating P-type ATPase [Marinobacter sp. X15-166B]